MIFTSRHRAVAPLILYHAISSYQLLEVTLHRMRFHAGDYAVLLLPDFIIHKYPQYRLLQANRFFDEVYLFPYLRIPHGSEAQVLADTSRYYCQTVPYEITTFSKIYVAGAHFYFSLYLIQNHIPFTFFEDAAGMLSRPGVLYQALAVGFPLHAGLARKYGLFTGQNSCVREIICLKKAQTAEAPGPVLLNFSVEEALEALVPRVRRRLIRFFLRRPVRTEAEAILLTQHFAGLGIMREEEQKQLYIRLRDEVLRGVRLAIKPHPDDTLDYREIFPHAQLIRAVFPAELLPYVFRKNSPACIYTFDSTGCANLSGHFIIRQIDRKRLMAGHSGTHTPEDGDHHAE